MARAEAHLLDSACVRARMVQLTRDAASTDDTDETGAPESHLLRITRQSESGTDDHNRNQQRADRRTRLIRHLEHATRGIVQHQCLHSDEVHAP